MPNLDCTTPAVVQEIPRVKNCGKVFVTRLAYGSYSDMDSDTIVQSDGVITDFGTTTGDFQYINAGLKDVTLTWDYTREAGLYTYTLAIDLRGATEETRAAVLDAQSICDLVFIMSLSNCQNRVGGLDLINDKVVNVLDSTASGHSGSIGGDAESSNLVTFTWESFSEMFFTDVDEENWPLPVTP